MKLIFLDVDGVLVNRKSIFVRSAGQATADPLCVAALNRIVQETGAAIVVSSCWRIGRTVIELRELMKAWGIVGKVIGKTPLYWELERGREISKWMEDFPHDVESFVILDDDSDMGTLIPRLVQTGFDEGLTEQAADRAITLLSEAVESEQK